MNIAALKHSVELELRADLCAANIDLRNANILLKESNAIRREAFGPFDVNQLRQMTHNAINARKDQAK